MARRSLLFGPLIQKFVHSTYFFVKLTLEWGKTDQFWPSGLLKIFRPAMKFELGSLDLMQCHTRKFWTNVIILKQKDIFESSSVCIKRRFIFLSDILKLKTMSTCTTSPSERAPTPGRAGNSFWFTTFTTTTTTITTTTTTITTTTTKLTATTTQTLLWGLG